MIGLLIALIYLAFIALGLPDAVLGSVWPSVGVQFGVPISNMGIITVIISFATICSSLLSNRMINKFGVYLITTISIGTTSIALLGFSSCTTFLQLCLWSIPYGIGAGSVDAALNNYVAVNFESKHMSWLHCMWGVGATLGPFVMGSVLTQGYVWNVGYIVLFSLQFILTFFLLISKSVWKCNSTNFSENNNSSKKSLSIKQILKIDGTIETMITFFCFCALEFTTGLWASSYLVLNRDVSILVATSFAGLFYLGITIGRGFCGFIAMKYSDAQMINFGCAIMFVGVLILALPLDKNFAFCGLTLIGLGSSPVYPCIIHSTPKNFGIENSQAITGVLMACAYTGTLIMPALFGIIANKISISLFPYFFGLLLTTIIFMYNKTLKKVESNLK